MNGNAEMDEWHRKRSDNNDEWIDRGKISSASRAVPVRKAPSPPVGPSDRAGG